MCRKPHLSRTLSFNKILLSNVTGSDERAEENYFRFMKTSPEKLSRDDINKINSPSLFRDMNNRWSCFCPSQALIHDSMPQAVLFIVFVIQYNFIENNIVNCRSNAKNKPQSSRFKIWQYASESAKVNNFWHMGIEKSTLMTRSN